MQEISKLAQRILTLSTPKEKEEEPKGPEISKGVVIPKPSTLQTVSDLPFKIKEEFPKHTYDSLDRLKREDHIDGGYIENEFDGDTAFCVKRTTYNPTSIPNLVWKNLSYDKEGNLTSIEHWVRVEKTTKKGTPKNKHEDVLDKVEYFTNEGRIDHYPEENIYLRFNKGVETTLVVE